MLLVLLLLLSASLLTSSSTSFEKHTHEIQSSSVPVDTIYLNSLKRDVILPGEYAKYNLDNNGTTLPWLHISLQSCQGDSDLYINAASEKSGYPTRHHFSYGSAHSGMTNEHNVLTTTGTYNVAVYCAESTTTPCSFELVTTASHSTESMDTVTGLGRRALDRIRQLNVTSVSHEAVEVSFNVIGPGTYTLYAFKNPLSHNINSACGLELASEGVVSESFSVEDSNTCTTNHGKSYKTQQLRRLYGLRNAQEYVLNLVYTPVDFPTTSQTVFVPRRTAVVDVKPLRHRVSGTVGAGEYHYYAVKNGNYNNNILTLSSSDDDADLYVHRNTLPTFIDYELMSATPGTDTIELEGDSSSYFVGVYSPEGASYTLTLGHVGSTSTNKSVSSTSYEETLQSILSHIGNFILFCLEEL